MKPDWMIWRKAAIAKGWKGWKTPALLKDPVGQVAAAKAWLKQHNYIVAALPDGTYLTRQTENYYSHVIVGFVRQNAELCGQWYPLEWTRVNPLGKARRYAKKTVTQRTTRRVYEQVKAIPVY